jgi:hypothetical protein
VKSTHPEKGQKLEQSFFVLLTHGTLVTWLTGQRAKKDEKVKVNVVLCLHSSWKLMLTTSFGCSGV